MKDKKNEKVRKVIVEVKNQMIEYDELYVIDSSTGEEVFDRNIEIENDIRLYDIYKKLNNLLTSNEIKNIRKKYNMNQKEFAAAIGVGEITIHRFENGSIQTDAVDAVIRLSENPENMYDLVLKNKNNISNESYNKFLNNISDLMKYQQHHIAKIKKIDFYKLNFQTTTAEMISCKIIELYNKNIDLMYQKFEIDDSSPSDAYITQLKLQKLLYFIQGLSLRFFDKPAFNNKIYNWAYGPVVKDVYYVYKSNGKKPINVEKCCDKLSEGLLKIIDVVINSYGKIESETLISLTHEEEPWLKTNKDDIIPTEKIKEYFIKVY